MTPGKQCKDKRSLIKKNKKHNKEPSTNPGGEECNTRLKN